jgi:hypothetical protein
MRLVTILLGIICAVVLHVPEVHATDTVYLPLVTTEPAQDYTLEWVRLWSVWENGGQPDPFACGLAHTLQVDVFDIHGQGRSVHPNAVNGRLNGVQVQVIHTDSAGNQSVEVKSTGSGEFDDGIALFDLRERATIQVIVDADGQPVYTTPVAVSTVIADIPLQELQAVGYCADEGACRALIDADACRGYFSWGVVFKQVEK